MLYVGWLATGRSTQRERGGLPFVELGLVQALMELLGTMRGESEQLRTLTLSMRVEIAFLDCGLLRNRHATEGLQDSGSRNASAALFVENRRLPMARVENAQRGNIIIRLVL